jgi:hypothetical protein
MFWGLAAVSVILLTGCFSVEVKTRVRRKGGGSRTYQIIMDQMLAGLYEKADSKMPLFEFPGQGLEKKQGIKILSKNKRMSPDGKLSLEWIYDAENVKSFSDGNDSLFLRIEKKGLWVYYHFRERIIPREKGTHPADFPEDGYRFRHILTLPGQVMAHDADSQAANQLVWIRSTGALASQGMGMEAVSREINVLYLVTALVVLSLLSGLAAIITPQIREYFKIC